MAKDLLDVMGGKRGRRMRPDLDPWKTKAPKDDYQTQQRIKEGSTVGKKYKPAPMPKDADIDAVLAMIRRRP